MGLQVPIINGKRYDYASILTMVNGLPKLGRTITSIEYSDSIQRGVVRAGARLPIGYTGGEYSAEGSIEMPIEERDIFLAEIASGGIARGRYDAAFELTVSFAELGQRTIVDQLNGCRLNGTEQTFQRGPEGLVVRFPISIHLLILNGSLPFSGDQLAR
jgi:hypothetical protein